MHSLFCSLIHPRERYLAIVTTSRYRDMSTRAFKRTILLAYNKRVPLAPSGEKSSECGTNSETEILAEDLACCKITEA